MKINKWVGVLVCLAIMAVCFMPWTYHADVQKNFTGFFSEKDAYGSPGKYFIFFSTVSLLLILIPKLWAKRTHWFIPGIMVAYAIKTYILYTSCYNAYCPDKKAGIFLIVGLSLLMFAISLFPDVELSAPKQKNDE
jgi:hypothetical protein